MIFVIGQLKYTLKNLKDEQEQEVLTGYDLAESNLLISQFEEAIEILEAHSSMLMLKGEISIKDYVEGVVR